MADVIVVGAGPTGLTLACGLTAAGTRVRVLDRAAGPAITSRALGLQPRGVEVLDRIGALGDLPQRGLPIREVAVRVGGRELARLQVGQQTRLRGPRALLMSQADIEQALRERFTELGGHVEWGCQVNALEHSATGIALSTDDGDTLRGSWVVGADGAHSAIRKAADIGFPGVPIVERFLLADVHAQLDRPRDTVVVWLDGDRMLAAFPLPGPDLWRLMSPADADTTPESDDIARYLGQRLADESGASVTSVEWTSSFGIQRRLADTYRAGRVLVAGDAAHIHSPFGGQGMNTGIGDAENLAFKLALVVAGRADAGLLDTYEAERRPVAEEVLANTTGLTRIVTGDNLFARRLRDMVLVPLMNRAVVQRFIAEKSSQLQLSYRRGPLGASGLKRPRPGDRIPDREYTRADGEPTRLYRELGPAWALAGPGELADLAAARLGEVAALTATGSAAMLIRPDGHLAWRGTSTDSLRRWLDQVLGNPRPAQHLSA